MIFWKKISHLKMCNGATGAEQETKQEPNAISASFKLKGAVHIFASHFDIVSLPFLWKLSPRYHCSLHVICVREKTCGLICDSVTSLEKSVSGQLLLIDSFHRLPTRLPGSGRFGSAVALVRTCTGCIPSLPLLLATPLLEPSIWRSWGTLLLIVRAFSAPQLTQGETKSHQRQCMSHEEQWQGSRVSHKCFFYNSSLWIFIGSPRYLVTTVVTNLFFFLRKFGHKFCDH